MWARAGAGIAMYLSGLEKRNKRVRWGGGRVNEESE